MKQPANKSTIFALHPAGMFVLPGLDVYFQTMNFTPQQFGVFFSTNRTLQGYMKVSAAQIYMWRNVTHDKAVEAALLHSFKLVRKLTSMRNEMNFKT